MEVIQKKDIIMFGLQPWDIEVGSNFKNMALEIAKHHHVLYVNRPLDNITFLKKRNDPKVKTRIGSIKKGDNILTLIQDNLWVFNPPIMLASINWLPHNFIYTFFNKRNNKKLARAIKWASGQLTFKNCLVIIDNDFLNALYLKELLSPALFIYYIRDYLLSQPYFDKHGQYAEPAIMEKADAVVANSLYLANYGKKYNSLSVDIGQGCEIDNFVRQSGNIPQDIQGIKKPIIGYCGALTAMRLDLELICFIATQRPEWQVVLVGPEDDVFKTSKLHQLPNIHFLGAKPPILLPAYVHSFDVCINPQALNQMTMGNYPRKIDEYLAAGKPVVATLTEAMQVFAEVTFLCRGKEDYIPAIHTALSEKNDNLVKQRIKLAQSHTWQNSVALLYQAISEIKIN